MRVLRQQLQVAAAREELWIEVVDQDCFGKRTAMKEALLSLLAVAAASQLVACSSANDATDSDATVRVGWSLVVNDAPGSCASVGATDIRVIASKGSADTIVDFACQTSGSGEFDIDEGVYTIEVQLIDATGNQLNSVDIVSTQDLVAGDVLDLGIFVFAFIL